MKRTIAVDRDVTISVDHTPKDHTDLLGPVTFIMQTGRAFIHVYMQPDDARNIADALREAANDVDGHDDDYRASLREGSR